MLSAASSTAQHSNTALLLFHRFSPHFPATRPLTLHHISQTGFEHYPFQHAAHSNCTPHSSSPLLIVCCSARWPACVVLEWLYNCYRQPLCIHLVYSLIPQQIWRPYYPSPLPPPLSPSPTSTPMPQPQSSTGHTAASPAQPTAAHRSTRPHPALDASDATSMPCCRPTRGTAAAATTTRPARWSVRKATRRYGATSGAESSSEPAKSSSMAASACRSTREPVTKRGEADCSGG